VQHPSLLRCVLIGVSILTEISGGGLLSAGQEAASKQTPREAVLSGAELNRFMPETMFYHGEQLSVESRNSEGISFADGRYLLAALLDNSGHASEANQEPLACLVTEVIIKINGHRLMPGVYGLKLDGRNHFIVTDIAADRVFAVDSGWDKDLHRPRPLQIISSKETNQYRLYVERNFLSITRAPESSK
jgi:hypothetical protein